MKIDNQQGGGMDKMDWIKDLVSAERKIEETGMVDISTGFDDKHLKQETIKFLLDIKNIFIDSASLFNQMRGLTVGGVKIYGISNTDADFMLFRNGYKLLFSMKKQGVVRICFAYQTTSIMPKNPKNGENKLQDTTNEDILEAKWGSFGQLRWTHRNQAIDIFYLVRYYLSRFIKESAK